MTSQIRNNIQALLDIATEKFQKEWIERYEYWFERKWNENESKNFINSKEGSKLHAKLKENKTQAELFINGNVKNWDLTLLQISFTQTDWPKTMKLTKKQQSRMKSLLEIIEIRNRFAHNSFHTSNEHLNLDLEKLKKILIDDLGFDSEMIEDQIKTYKPIENDKFEIEDSSNDSKASEFREKANKLFGEKKWIEALKIYNEALGLDKISTTEKAKLYSNRSTTRVKLSQHKAALDDAEEVIKAMPDWFRGYERKGDALFSMFKYDEAKKEFEYAFSLARTEKKLLEKISNCESEKSKADRYEHLNSNFNKTSVDALKYWGEKRKDSLNLPTMKYLEILRSLAEKGDINAQVRLALTYLDGGEGIEIDSEKALKMLEAAAQKNNAEALYNLGILYLHGQVVEIDHQKAWELLNRAIQQPEFNFQYQKRNIGVAEAYQAIGNHYFYGKIPVQKNHSLAFKNYKKAADLGCMISNNDIGVAYRWGNGVDVDFVKALQYFELAASYGQNVAIVNAAEMYVKGFGCPAGIPNLDKAIELLKPCAEKEFPPAVQLLKQIESIWKSDEKSKTSQRILTTLIQNDPVLSKMTEYIQRIQERDQVQGHLQNKVGFKVHLKELEPYVRGGSRFAKRICEAQLLFFESLELIEIGINGDNVEAMRLFIRKLSEAIQKFDQVVHLGFIVEPLLKIISTLEKSNNNSQSCFRDILVVRAALYQLPQPGETIITSWAQIQFLDQTCLKAFPKDSYFLEKLMIAHGVAKRDERALEVFERINKNDITIDNCDIYYFAAVCQANDPTENIRKFLSMCAKDDRKRPAAFYLHCSWIYRNDKKNVELIKKLYEQGLEVEKDQLPPFLPYEQGTKEFVEKMIIPFLEYKPKPKMDPKLLLKPDWNSFNSTDSKLNDISRHNVILMNRKGFCDAKTMDQTMRNHIRLSLDQGKAIKFNTPNFQNLKEITLSEMTTLDITYSNRKLVGRLIGKFYRLASVFSVIEDIERNVKRIVFYNVPESEWNERFRIGNLIEVTNPHLRMAQDMKPMIRVDNPKSWKVIDNQKICTFCGSLLKSENVKKCSNCKSPYCSIECQHRDWKELQHKLVCSDEILFHK